jgi:hypothetical protein
MKYAYLITTSSLFISMVLMDDEMIREDIERYSGKIHFEQACSFVSTVAYKSFITPVIGHCERTNMYAWVQEFYHGADDFLNTTYGS